MFEESLLSDFAKAIWFMASSITDSNKSSVQSSCLKVHRLSITKTFIMSDNFLQWFWFFWKCVYPFYSIIPVRVRGCQVIG